MHLHLLTPCLLLAICASVRATSTEVVLGKLDQAAPKFTGMTADLNRVSYTKVLDDKATEKGAVRLRKAGRELHVFIEFATPDPKIVAVRGRKAEMYLPKLKTVQEYDLGKQSDLVDQFLLVGFGTTGRELQANYSIKYAGEETVAGQKAWKLELLPQSAKLKEKLRRLEIWIAENGAYPVQQMFLQPSGDYYLFTYSNVKLNPALTDEDLKLKLPKGVKREFPQK